MLKDLRLAQEAASSVGASTPLGAEAAQLYALYVAADHGGDDFSGIINFLRGACTETLELFPSRHSFRPRTRRSGPISGRSVPMRVSIKKTVVAAIAALGMATAIAAMPTPAEAQWHGGGGGFHGGGGGFTAVAWAAAGTAAVGEAAAGMAAAGAARLGRRLGLAAGGGWGGWGGGWGGGCWNCGWGWGGGWGWGWDPGWAIAAATVPVGVAIASQPAYGGDPGCWVRRRVWTASGHYLGRRLVNICM